ncbi:MAG: hypothetical protein IKJ36_01880 [Clostridia bacterium]|nr:hypothetical protein [Clostridia bacterium]
MASENLVNDLFEIIQSNTKEKLSYDDFEKDLAKSINLPNDEIDRALSIMLSQAEVNPNIIGESKGGTFVISPSFSASVVSTIKYENQFIEGKVENAERNSINNKSDILIDAAFAANIIITPKLIDHMIQNYSTLSNNEKNQLLDNVSNMSVSQIRALNDSVNRSAEQLAKKDSTGIAKNVILSAQNHATSSNKKLDAIESGNPEIIDQEVSQSGVSVVVYEAEDVFTQEEMERLSEIETEEIPEEPTLDETVGETLQEQPGIPKEDISADGGLNLHQNGAKSFGFSNKRYASQGAHRIKVLNDNPKSTAYRLLVERARQEGTYATADMLLGEIPIDNQVQLRGMTIEISPQVIATFTEKGIKIFNFSSERIDTKQLVDMQNKVIGIANKWGTQDDKIAILKEGASLDAALGLIDDITANSYLEITRACTEQDWDALSYYIGTDSRLFKAISEKFKLTSISDIKIGLTQGTIKEDELLDVARGLRKTEYDSVQKDFLQNDTVYHKMKDSIFGSFVPLENEGKKEQDDRTADRFVLEIKKAKMKILTLGVKGESIRKALETYKEMLESAGEMIIDGDFESDEELIDFLNRESEEKELTEEEKKVLKVLTQIKYSEDMSMFIATDSEKIFGELDKQFVGKGKISDKYIDGLVSQQGVDIVTSAITSMSRLGDEVQNKETNEKIDKYGYSKLGYKKNVVEMEQNSEMSNHDDKKAFFAGSKSIIKSVRMGQVEESTLELRDIGRLVEKYKEEKGSSVLTEQDDESRSDDDEPIQ